MMNWSQQHHQSHADDTNRAHQEPNPATHAGTLDPYAVTIDTQLGRAGVASHHDQGPAASDVPVARPLWVAGCQADRLVARVPHSPRRDKS